MGEVGGSEERNVKIEVIGCLEIASKPSSTLECMNMRNAPQKFLFQSHLLLD